MTIDVLVVDDTAVARRLVVRAIEADPEIRALGTASSGQEALELLDGVLPDLVTLDLEMPGLDGLATLRLLRRRHPRLPVVVVSSLSEPGARKALEALAVGANDFVTKPQRVASIEAGLEGLRHQLVPKIKALHGKSQRQRPKAAGAGAGVGADAGAAAVPAQGPRSGAATRNRPAEHPPAQPQGASPSRTSQSVAPEPFSRPVVRGAGVRRHDASSPTVPASRPGARASARVARPAAPLGAPKLGGPAGRGVGVITIGGSTGGPQALEALLSPLPADLPVPVLVVQHMPPTFTRLLAERLDSVCRLTVREAVDGEPVVAGEVLIAPGDVHLSLTRRNGTVVTHLDGRPPENHCRPAVDVLFRAVAEQYGARALGVVLTGMGVDGLVGARALLDAGSPTVVQDEETSVVWGMAGAVASAGLAQQVLPLTALPAVLMDAARVNRVPRSATPPAFRERVGP